MPPAPERETALRHRDRVLDFKAPCELSFVKMNAPSAGVAEIGKERKRIVKLERRVVEEWRKAHPPEDPTAKPVDSDAMEVGHAPEGEMKNLGMPLCLPWKPECINVGLSLLVGMSLAALLLGSNKRSLALLFRRELCMRRGDLPGRRADLCWERGLFNTRPR
ncbi:hypothetical protein AURDEDRAFT_168923 [Auricularia subglabra TFB-10046 SS5]|nr:hypothetical protein AURDEDRAFT_168923 [Auricularia subglabra TFB-10046 SS5]